MLFWWLKMKNPPLFVWLKWSLIFGIRKRGTVFWKGRRENKKAKNALKIAERKKVLIFANKCKMRKWVRFCKTADLCRKNIRRKNTPYKRPNRELFKIRPNLICGVYRYTPFSIWDTESRRGGNGARLLVYRCFFTGRPACLLGKWLTHLLVCKIPLWALAVGGVEIRGASG